MGNEGDGESFTIPVQQAHKRKQQPNFLCVQLQKIKERGRTFLQVNVDSPLKLGTEN
jgi:hypothetical protein